MWSAPDREALSAPHIRESMALSLVEALRQNAKGAAYEGRLLGKQGWGFRLADIRFPEIYLWHGGRDKDVPLQHAQQVAEQLVQCNVHWFPDEGHISVLVNHQEEILKLLSNTSGE